MSKDRTVMRADLRLDLKDTGALWSDAELNRCIDRAVSDFSRFLPREMVYEEILDFAVTGESVTFPKDTSATYVVNAQTLESKVAGDSITIAAQPDVPRVLTFLVTDANSTITDFNFRIHGTDENDIGAREDFYFGNGLSQTGKQIFKRVHKVELISISGTAATADTISIGIGAYTNTWVYLAYKPVKWQSESATDAASAAITRGTDFLIDYILGRVKAISGGSIAAEEVCTFAYTKNQTHIDLTALSNFIRVHRVEYPVGDIPQSFCQYDIFGKRLSITGMGESDEQRSLASGEQVRIYYDASHFPPTDYAPGTVPGFLEDTVLHAAGAYALFVYSLKSEHQAITDLASARVASAAAITAQTAIDTALTSMRQYLDDNATDDAATVLASIDALHTAVTTALDAANAYLDAVASDLTNADGVAADYIGATNYVDGGTEPDILAYLTSGDALINSITEGGENERTPEMYANYAQIAKNALVASFEQSRAFYQQDATARTNAALGFVQEAVQRLSDVRTYIEQAEGYTSVAFMFAREAELRVSQADSYLREVAAYCDTAANDLLTADRFRAEATARRDEVWTIWRDRKEYIGDFASSSMRQMVSDN